MVMSDLMVMSKSWQKLSAGDMVASVAKYHTPCLAGYYNKAAKLHNKIHVTNDMVCHSKAFAELVYNIENVCANEEIKSVFSFK